MRPKSKELNPDTKPEDRRMMSERYRDGDTTIPFKAHPLSNHTKEFPDGSVLYHGEAYRTQREWNLAMEAISDAIHSEMYGRGNDSRF